MTEQKVDIAEEIRFVSEEPVGPDADDRAAPSLHDLHFDEFLNDKLFFRPLDGHHRLEVRVLRSGLGDAFLHEEEVKETAISSWVQNCAHGVGISPDTETRLRLLYVIQIPLVWTRLIETGFLHRGQTESRPFRCLFRQQH